MKRLSLTHALLAGLLIAAGMLLVGVLHAPHANALSFGIPDFNDHAYGVPDYGRLRNLVVASGDLDSPVAWAWLYVPTTSTTFNVTVNDAWQCGNGSIFPAPYNHYDGGNYYPTIYSMEAGPAWTVISSQYNNDNGNCGGAANIALTGTIPAGTPTITTMIGGAPVNFYRLIFNATLIGVPNPAVFIENEFNLDASPTPGAWMGYAGDLYANPPSGPSTSSQFAVANTFGNSDGDQLAVGVEFGLPCDPAHPAGNPYVINGGIFSYDDDYLRSFQPVAITWKLMSRTRADSDGEAYVDTGLGGSLTGGDHSTVELAVSLDSDHDYMLVFDHVMRQNGVQFKLPFPTIEAYTPACGSPPVDRPPAAIVSIDCANQRLIITATDPDPGNFSVSVEFDGIPQAPITGPQTNYAYAMPMDQFFGHSAKVYTYGIGPGGGPGTIYAEGTTSSTPCRFASIKCVFSAPAIISAGGSVPITAILTHVASDAQTFPAKTFSLRLTNTTTGTVTLIQNLNSAAMTGHPNPPYNVQNLAYTPFTIGAAGDYQITVAPPDWSPYAGPTPDSNCGAGGGFGVPIKVVYQPYMRMYGGDVIAGSGFQAGDTPCVTDPTAGINAYSVAPGGPRTTYGGGAAEFAAFALSTINGFYSAALRPPWPSPGPSPINGLDFANNPTNGGFTGGAPICAADYWNDPPLGATTAANLTHADTVGAYHTAYAAAGGGTKDALDLKDLAAAAAGATKAYYYKVGAAQNQVVGTEPFINLRNTGGAYTGHIALYIDGNVNIDDNIVYNPNYTYNAATNVITMPNLSLIVHGYIMIRPGVSEIDGLYVAQPATAATQDGTIFTCAPAYRRTQHAVGNNQYFSAPSGCDTQLTVIGSLIAKNISWGRLTGTVLAAPDFENYPATGNTAENILYTPELYGTTLPFKPTTSSTVGAPAKYEISLPPVF